MQSLKLNTMKTVNVLLTLIAIAGLKLSFAQGTWTQKTTMPGPPRIEAGSFELNGKGYVVCGRDPGTQTYYTDVWEYDPSTDTWTQKGNFPGAGRREPVTYVLNGKGYLGTGRDLSGAFNDFWEYNPTTDTWTQKANFPGGGRRDALGFALGNKCYLGSGQTISGFTAVAQTDWWEYDPATNVWTQKGTLPGPARNAGQAIATATKGYMGLGRVTNGNINDWWEYDQATDTWTQKANYGPGNRDETSAFYIGSVIYVGTGHSGTNQPDWWQFDPANNTWTQVASMAVGHFEMTPFVLNGKGYVATGYSTVLHAETWEFTPPASLPTLTASNISNSFSTIVGTPSASQSFNVSGTSLTANIVITAPTNFEVSLSSGSGFGATVSITPSGGTVNSTPVYVRYNPSAAGTHNGNVTVSSTGLTTQNVSVTGTSSNPGNPNLVASGTINPFTTTVGTPSVAQSFTVDGTNLTANLVVTAPSNFEVSLSSGSGYASSVSLTPNAGTVATTTIYVRYNPSTSGSHNGSVLVTSTGANNQSILLIGTSNGVGINEITDHYQVVTYPNPMTTYTTIEVRNGEAMVKEDVHINITDMSGKSVNSKSDIVASEKNGVVGLTIQKGSLENGLYFFEISHKDKLVASGKILIQ